MLGNYRLSMKQKKAFRVDGGHSRLHFKRFYAERAEFCEIRGYVFREFCGIAELPDNRLAFTGGIRRTYLTRRMSRGCVVIDQHRDLSATTTAMMTTRRAKHASVYYDGYLYVIGGSDASIAIRSCERLSLVRSEWESLPDLPSPMSFCSAEIKESTKSLFNIGLCFDTSYTQAGYFIAELNLITLEWRALTVILGSDNMQPISYVKGDEVYFLSKLSIVNRVSAEGDVQYVKQTSARLLRVFENFSAPRKCLLF
jgi:hypothetical protein